MIGIVQPALQIIFELLLQDAIITLFFVGDELNANSVRPSALL